MNIPNVSQQAREQQQNIQNPPTVDSSYSGQPEAMMDGAFSSSEGTPPVPVPGQIIGAPPISGVVGVPGAVPGGIPGAVPGIPTIPGIPPATGGVTFGQPSEGQPGYVPPGQQAGDKKEDFYDLTVKAISEGGKASASFIKEFIGSLQNRNLEDWAIISNIWFKFGIPLSAIGLVLVIAGALSRLKFLGMIGIGGISLITGVLTISFGLLGLGITLYLKTSSGSYEETGGNFKEIPEFADANASDGGFNSILDDTSDMEIEDDDTDYDYDDLLADMGIVGDDEDEDEDDYEPPVAVSTPNTNSEHIDYNRLVDGVRGNQNILTRKMLWDIFKPFFPTLNTNFSHSEDLDLMSQTATDIGATINKAMSRLFPKADIEDTECRLVKVVESNFSYEVTFERPRQKVKAEQLQEELTISFRSGRDDTSVVVVDVVQDNFIATIPKTNKNAITLGDAFTKREVEEFFLNKTFPIVTGIGPLGEVGLMDAKKIYSMVITGKPGSGKSSYVSSLLLSLVTMNSPEDVQILIFDPKDSMLFRTYALLPHVCGRHSDTKTLIAVLEAVIKGEGERRQRLFQENGVENIWELRERKNVKLPILYVVIDELVSIQTDMKDLGTAGPFQSNLSTLITKLRAHGIVFIGIPHRTTGIMNPTARNNIYYRACVMEDNKSVEEELGISKWRTPLTNPGMLAMKAIENREAMFLRGICPVPPDKEADFRTRELICNIARTWYKIGAPMPDMSALGVAYNRDENYIKERLELTLNPNKIQYDLDLDGYRTDL